MIFHQAEKRPDSPNRYEMTDILFTDTQYCVKSFHIQSFSGLNSVQLRENTDQKNSEYGHFSYNVGFQY